MTSHMIQLTEEGPHLYLRRGYHNSSLFTAISVPTFCVTYLLYSSGGTTLTPTLTLFICLFRFFTTWGLMS